MMIYKLIYNNTPNQQNIQDTKATLILSRLLTLGHGRRQAKGPTHTGEWISRHTD